MNGYPMIYLASKMRISLSKAAMATVLLFLSCSAYADYSITAGELMQLPRFCRQLSEGNFAADAKRYRIDAPQPAWMQHFQHYCHGLKDMVRSTRASNKNDRIYKLNEALNEFQYVLTHTQDSPEFYPYLAMVSVDRGRAYVRMGKDSDAVAELMKAIRLKPDYATAYIELINVYLNLGNREGALNIAQEGLTRTPDSKILQKRYRDLGGKLPYPAPAEKKEEPVPQANENSAQSAAELPAINQAPTDAPPVPEDGQSVKEPLPTNSSGNTTIGTPTNPWCRFCTDSDIKPQ
ncbi:MAG: tetratricopeptide repeat protein [Gammaproteobacteria bacterium]|nr:tetratricopeptide repeat protein [Gammaproteobacteria bacterium]MBU1978570.1 tetratricopeptide repeat protein [Gammaproteobacteria bacterium]